MSDNRNTMPVLTQPTGRIPSTPKYMGGSKRAVARLQQLSFDPIGELVYNYRKLQSELDRQEKLRSGEIVELSATGRPRSYRPEIHHALFDKLNAISEKLLRYGYGRVPETTIIDEKQPSPLVINLTKKGEAYIVNDNPDIDEDNDDEY